MDTNKMREQFERLFGMPVEESKLFGPVWQRAWKDSREAVVVDFSPVRKEADNHSFGGEEAVFHAAVKAIEALGLKVAP